MVQLGSSIGNTDYIVSLLEKLNGYFVQWKSLPLEKQDAYLKISDATSVLADKLVSFESLAKALLLPLKDPKQGVQLAMRACKLAIETPCVLVFDEFITMQALTHLDPKLVTLLKIFNQGSLKDYQAFVAENPVILKEAGISGEKCLEKMRVLTLASLACAHIGKELAYSEIESLLQIGADQAEAWLMKGTFL